MHELGLTIEIVDAVCTAARTAKVKRVVVAVGALAAVEPDAMRFCFETCAADTVLAGATLEIRRVPARARCRTCGDDFELDGPVGRCACGSGDLEWISGDELRVVGYETENP